MIFPPTRSLRASGITEYQVQHKAGCRAVFRYGMLFTACQLHSGFTFLNRGYGTVKGVLESFPHVQVCSKGFGVTVPCTLTPRGWCRATPPSRTLVLNEPLREPNCQTWFPSDPGARVTRSGCLAGGMTCVGILFRRSTRFAVRLPGTPA